MTTELQIKLVLGEGFLIQIGPIIDCTEHQHHAVQILIGLGKEFEIRCDGVSTIHRTVIIAPDISHLINTPDNWYLNLLLDNDSNIAKRLKSKFLSDCSAKNLDDFFAMSFLAELSPLTEALGSPKAANSLIERIFSLLIDSRAVQLPQIDSRVQKSIELIKELDSKKISTNELAQQVGLSESRLSHLFKVHTGIPVRRYLLWKRLTEAIKVALHGASLTEAAYQADFADSAHLSRTFRSMFGVSPSFFSKNSQFIQVISYFE